MLRYVLLAASALQATADADACAAALADMANPQSKNAAKNALASFTCPNVLAAAQWSWTSPDTYAFMLRQHMSDFGDPDACESIQGFRYVAAQYPFGQFGLCVPHECDAENLNELRKTGTQIPVVGQPMKVVSGRFRFRMGAGGGFMVALFVILVVAALVATACEPRIVAHVKGLVYKEDHDEVYQGPAWLQCFSLVRNYDQWLSRREDNPLSCLDGVRVVSMLMVIHGHTLFLGIYGMYTNVFSAIYPPDGLASTAWGQSLLSDEHFFSSNLQLGTAVIPKWEEKDSHGLEN